MFLPTFALATFVLVLVGCHAPPATSVEMPNSAPPDFSIDLAVVVGAAVPEVRDSGFLASHYVVFNDGALHYGPPIRRSGDTNWLPPLVRTLSRRQMDELWSVARQLNLVEPDQRDEPMNFRLARPQEEEILYLAAFTGGGQRWNIVQHHHMDQSFVGSIPLLARHLAQLAWVQEEIAESDETAQQNDF